MIFPIKKQKSEDYSKLLEVCPECSSATYSKVGKHFICHEGHMFTKEGMVYHTRLVRSEPMLPRADIDETFDI